jgi:hypothetical protein
MIARATLLARIELQQQSSQGAQRFPGFIRFSWVHPEGARVICYNYLFLMYFSVLFVVGHFFQIRHVR